MKQFTRLLAALVFASLVIFISCKKKKGSDPDPLDVQADKLESATWVASEISKNDVTENIGDWSGFTISFQYNDETDVGQYTVSGVPTIAGASDVWGIEAGSATGTQAWEFENKTNTGVVVRQDDGIRMNVSVTEGSSLAVTFNIPTSGGRVAGFDGNWEFNLTPQ